MGKLHNAANVLMALTVQLKMAKMIKFVSFHHNSTTIVKKEEKPKGNKREKCSIVSRSSLWKDCPSPLMLIGVRKSTQASASSQP